MYHDANHIRRMWGYDKRKLQKRGALTREQKIAIYREQDAYIKSMLQATAFKEGKDENERQLRKLMRVI
jgi:hypothetical protein